MANPPETLVVLESFIGKVGSDEILFRQGDSIKSTHPAVKKWPTKFGPTIFHHDRAEV